jgi:hypothetical protein
MKKLVLIVLSAMLSFVSVKAAELSETFDSESMSNLVEKVNIKASACDPKSDESSCLLVTAKIRRFCDEVDSAESIPAAKAAEVREVLTELRLALTVVNEKVEDATDSKEMRLEQLSGGSAPTGTAYGINLAEARSMVTAQFNSDLISLAHVGKAVRALDARLRDKIKALQK